MTEETCNLADIMEEREKARECELCKQEKPQKNYRLCDKCKDTKKLQNTETTYAKVFMRI